MQLLLLLRINTDTGLGAGWLTVNQQLGIVCRFYFRVPTVDCPLRTAEFARPALEPIRSQATSQWIRCLLGVRNITEALFPDVTEDHG